jgi:Txe/YoeB family toxin of Txe-Axe toxin-antitoxin module
MTPSRRSPLLRISRLVDNQSESKQKGFLTIRRVSLILYENPKQIIVGGDFVMPRLTFKETVTKEIEIPLDKLFAIIDQLSSDDLFESNPSHPSLNTELLEPKHLLIYSLRIDLKHRALFICHPNDKIEIIAVTKHYRER